MINKKVIYQIIFSIALIIFVVCAFVLMKLYLPEKNNSSTYKNNTSSSSESKSELPDNPIDFKKLKKTNSDVYAWITVPGTKIDYAVACSTGDADDLFYLNHNIKKEYEFAGMIFSQKRNSKDMTDPVTVLYGHNMKNGSMFAGLHKFQTKSFFDKHDTFYIYTDGHIFTYKIAAAYVYDNRHILNSYDFSKKKEFRKYIKSIKNPKSMTCNTRDIEITTNDRIVTLSTCTSSDSQRYLVQGVLENEQLTK